MEKISEEKVAELVQKCGLSAQKAREALEKHGGEVDPTLEKLIDSGEVKLTMLNPKLVSPIMFVRAQLKRTTEGMKEAAAKLGMEGPAIGDPGPLIEMYKQLMGNAKPDKRATAALEQLVENEKRREELEKRSPMKLELAPFGKLKFEQYFWQGEVVLKSWAGFQTHVGAHGSRPSRGKVMLMIEPQGKANEPEEPGKEQIAAFEFVKEHEQELSKVILEAIFKEYHKLRKTYGSIVDDAMPAIKSAQELKKLIQLGALHILNRAKSGMAYVGFDFDCNWDPEHGLGVLTHGMRIVEVGIADTSFDERKAEEDGGKRVG